MNVFSTTPNHDFKNQTINGRSKNYDYGLGTSMSSPMVAALIRSTERGRDLELLGEKSPVSEADRIPGTGTYWSAGRVNAANAVAP